MSAIDYSRPGPLTRLESTPAWALASLPEDPLALCRPVHGLVLQPSEARTLSLPAERFSENQIRPADRLVSTLLGLDPTPLTFPRPATHRVVGTCRHFALLSCALLRHRGIPARVRCGFATYFQRGQGLDHWITEYRGGRRSGWVRMDSEILGGNVLDHPENLRPGEFLSGGEAWTAYRRGSIDAATFGVCGSKNWGPAEIRGNVVKDLAALNKVEMLPWDEWGRMTEAYAGETGSEYDELLDRVAAAAEEDDPPRLASLYERSELRVPAEMIR